MVFYRIDQPAAKTGANSGKGANHFAKLTPWEGSISRHTRHPELARQSSGSNNGAPPLRREIKPSTGLRSRGPERGFGNRIKSTDALGRVTTWEFDTLGRTTKRLDKHGAQISSTSWTWDTAPNGIGRLHSVISPDAAKTYSYNERGQTASVKLGVNGDVFAAQLHYDEFGRVKALDYPQPLDQAPFGVAYDYDAHGFRTAVRDKATNDAFWQLKDVDDTGRYREESFGNGVKTVRGYHNAKHTLTSITTTLGGSTIQQLSYDWDQRLNLKSRTDARQPTNKTERFRYDALDRLTCAYFSPMENPGAPCATSIDRNGDRYQRQPNRKTQLRSIWSTA